MSKKKSSNTAAQPAPAQGRDNQDINKSESKASEEREGDEDDEEDEDEEDDKVEKGMIALQDLEKGLETLEAVGRGAQRTRKDELLDKARGERLSPEEFRELEAATTGRNLAKSLEQSDDLVKGMDVSPALDILATKVSEAVDALSERLEKSESHRGEFEEALAQSLVAMGAVLRAQQEQIAGLSADLQKSLDGPARPPKAEDKPTSKAVERTAAAQEGAKPEGMNRRQFTKVLETMHRDSIQKGMGGYSASGVSIKSEIAKALSEGSTPDPRILKDAAEFIKTAR